MNPRIRIHTNTVTDAETVLRKLDFVELWNCNISKNSPFLSYTPNTLATLTNWAEQMQQKDSISYQVFALRSEPALAMFTFNKNFTKGKSAELGTADKKVQIIGNYQT